MSEDPRTTITIEAISKYDTSYSREVVQAPYESDEAFIERVRKALEQLRHEVP